MSDGKTHTLTKSSLFIFLIRFFPQLATVLVMILFSRELSVETYGTYQNFWVQTFLLNTVACLGIPAFIFTYPGDYILSLFRNLKRTHFFLFAGWLLLFGFIFLWLQSGNSSVLWYVLLGFIPVYALISVIEAFFINIAGYKNVLVVNIVYALVFCYLHFTYWINLGDISDLFTGIFLLLLAKLVVYLFLLISKLRSLQVKPVDSYPYPKAFNLWMHLGFYDVSQMVFRWLDKFIVSLLLAESVSAVYFNGTTDIPFLPILLGAVGSAALIQMAQSGSFDNEYAIVIAHKSSRILSAIVFPLFFFFLAFKQELFQVVLSDKYLASVPVFSVSILTIPLSAYNLTTILQNRHRGSTINKGAILDLLIACGLMYPMYLLMGLPGIALSFVISSYIQAGYYVYHTSKVLGVRWIELLPLANWIIKLIVFSILFIGIHYSLSLVFSQLYVLFLGVLLTVMICGVSFFIELRITRNKYGKTTAIS